MLTLGNRFPMIISFPLKRKGKKKKGKTHNTLALNSRAGLFFSTQLCCIISSIQVFALACLMIQLYQVGLFSSKGQDSWSGVETDFYILVFRFILFSLSLLYLEQKKGSFPNKPLLNQDVGDLSQLVRPPSHQASPAGWITPDGAVLPSGPCGTDAGGCWAQAAHSCAERQPRFKPLVSLVEKTANLPWKLGVTGTWGTA